MLSNTSKYGIKAVLYLAMNVQGNEKIGIKKISNELGIPTPFLGKILQSLAKHKLLSSTKGPHGGFGLGKPSHEIHLIDIVEVLDGLDFFEECLISPEPCAQAMGKDYHCPVHSKYAPIRSQLYELFRQESIGSLVEDTRKSGKHIKL